MSLSAVIDLLRCPHCRQQLSIIERSAGCPAGHHFDLARQGYLNLLAGRQPTHADTADMVNARDRFLGGHHYQALADVIADRAVDAVGHGTAPRIVESGAGTGYYLATTLARLRTATGLATDISVPACRRAARIDDRIGAVVADTWAGLPLADHRVDLLLVIFAPRNPAEFARLLKPDGRVIIAGPGPDHLRQLRESLGLLGIEADKQHRLRATMGARLQPLDSRRIRRTVRLAAPDLVALVEMGPNAHHTAGRTAERVAALDPPLEVDLDVWISEFGSPGL